MRRLEQDLLPRNVLCTLEVAAYIKEEIEGIEKVVEFFEEVKQVRSSSLHNETTTHQRSSDRESAMYSY